MSARSSLRGCSSRRPRRLPTPAMVLLNSTYAILIFSSRKVRYLLYHNHAFPL